MRTRTKFWGGVILVLIITLFALNAKATLVTLGIVTFIICLIGVVFDGDNLGDESPKCNPQNHYDFPYSINIIYWINVFNKWLDKFDEDE